jgi:hypothetical protein
MVVMCEGCNKKQANFGTVGQGTKRWCGSCGQQHGAVNLTGKMCEGCNKKLASFGTAAEGTKRWCASCGKKHGAVNLSRKMCIYRTMCKLVRIEAQYSR